MIFMIKHLIVPVGSLEQHGPHLPLNTDYLIANRLANEIKAIFKAKIIKGIKIGMSPEHLSFKKTKSISEEEFIAQIEDIMKKYHKYLKFIFINAHGGNVRVLNSIQKKNETKMLVLNTFSIIKPELSKIRTSKIGGICHAGEFETSLMLYMYPKKVKMDLLSENSIKYVPFLDPNYENVRPMNWNTIDYSSSGIIGDPYHGTLEKGKKWFIFLVKNSRVLIDQFLLQ